MKSLRYILALLMCSIFCFLCVHSVVADAPVTLEFIYDSDCGPCQQKVPIIEEIEQKEQYQNTVDVIWMDIGYGGAYYELYQQEYKQKYGGRYIFCLVKNETDETLIERDNITVEYISEILDSYLEANASDTPGFELAILLASIAIVLIIVRKKERN